MEIKYPSLYDITNKRSERNQKYYFTALRVEYALLISSAVNAFLKYDFKYYTALFLFTILMLMVVFKLKSKFEREWYKYRAVTESIKTISWKFSMKSEPFNDKDESRNISQLASYLEGIVGGSEFISKSIDSVSVLKSTVSDEMKNIRKLSLDGRRDVYVKHRIDDQRDWYIGKAQSNKNLSLCWGVVVFCIYLIAFLCSLYNAFLTHNTESLFPISLITTIASALVGWVQVKRYSELAASYFLTAHEIGIIKEQSSYISGENDFSEFVRDAETAFSREHTQWLARRVANRQAPIKN